LAGLGGVWSSGVLVDRLWDRFVLYGTKSGGAAMSTQSMDDPVLKRFKAALNQMYGDQIVRVVLFGSRARGDALTDSDYDVAVFLKSLPDHRKEMNRLADLRVDFLDETGAFLDAKLFPAASYRDRTPLMHEIRRDGLDL
jgi:predicted nucleotidyltransferase